MAKFQFHLETVLQRREERENAAEQALAMARNEYNRRLALLEDTKESLENAYSISTRNSDAGFFDVISLSFYRTSLAKKVNNREKDVKTAGMIVDNRRREAIQARQDRQILENLKDKQRQSFMREENAREQKLADELASYMFYRREK